MTYNALPVFPSIAKGLESGATTFIECAAHSGNVRPYRATVYDSGRYVGQSGYCGSAAKAIRGALEDAERRTAKA